MGGIVGYSSYGVITDSSNSGAVRNAVDYAGGAAGCLQNGCSMLNCTNSGTVTGKNYVGGIVGCNYSQVSDCRNDGAVSGTGAYTGGVAGYLSTGNLHNCSYDETLNAALEIVGFNSAGSITFTENPTEYSIKYVDGNAVVTAAKAGSDTVLAASYNARGALLDANLIPLTFESAGEQTVSLQSLNISDAKTIKVMLWNRVDGMEPLCHADTVVQ